MAPHIGAVLSRVPADTVQRYLLSNAFVLIVPRGFRSVNGIVEHLHLAVALNGDVLRRASQE